MTVSGDNSGIVSTGANAVNIQLGGSPVRSQYLLQVERIAPPQLYGRESELAELAAFCTSGAGYAWWRAKAWSGKSALMSWFVLNPPPGVRIVSFFITSRLAAQNDRSAFVENVLEQLLTLLGEPMPFLTESTREAHLLDRLRLAASACRSRGEHLVLLVDGLDEDRGVDEHSIAALLPLDLSAGLRVIVAGRPNPPIPSDVPAHHPLRDPGIVRPLTPSPRAQVIRDQMMKDLKRLLRGPRAHQDLLGLVTAAGGGLTGPDLAQLTGMPRWQIDDCLDTVTGRVFAMRDPYFEPDSPDILLLGHEELQVTSVDLIGPARLASYRSLLHAWAARYRADHWPAGTPEYLLRGYFRMLVASDNLTEMLACATDPHRQDRLLDVTGGDVAALTEIATAMEKLAGQDSPDLMALTRLAIHRERLTDRNVEIPVELPAVWAMLGRVDRAESIAESISDVGYRTEALALVAKELIKAGNRARAIDLLDRADAALAATLFKEEKSYALTELASALAMAGVVDRAEAVLGSVRHPNEWGEAAGAVTAAVVANGDVDRAEAMTRSIGNAYYRAKALAPVAARLSAAGEADRVAHIVQQVCDLVHADAVQDKRNQVDVLVSLATALSAGGDTEHVAPLLRQAEAISAQVYDPDLTKCRLTEAWTAVGDLDRAATIPWTINDPSAQVRALVVAARGLGAAGRSEQAAELLDHADLLAHDILDSDAEDEALAVVAEGFAGIGDADRAVRTALSIWYPLRSSAALARLAAVLVLAGETEKASEVAVRAERTVRVATGVQERAMALAKTAQHLAKSGAASQAAKAIDRAEGIARSIAVGRVWTDTVKTLAIAAALGGDLDRVERIGPWLGGMENTVELWIEVAAGLAEAGLGDRAIDALDRAGPEAFSLSYSGSRWTAVSKVVRTLAGHGDLDRAETVANSVAVPNFRSALLASAAVSAARSADIEQASAIVGQIERMIRSSRNSRDDEEALPALVELLAMTGEIHRANKIARGIRNDGKRDEAWAALARVAAAAGDLEHARKLITLMSDTGRWPAYVRVAHAAAVSGRVDEAVDIALAIRRPYDRTMALLGIAQAVAAAGDVQRAEGTARLITDPEHRGEALVAVLRAQAAPVDPRLVAEVLLLTDWHLVVAEVVATAPDALTKILDEVERVCSAEVLGGVEEE